MMSNHKGFTIVEAIIVIVLAAIAMAVLIPRFMQPNAFDEAAAQDGIITTIRAAQQAALGRSNVRFAINASGDWIFTANAGATTLRSLQVSAASIELETGSAVWSADTCADQPGAFNTAVASDFELTFDASGNIATFVNGGVTEFAGPTFNGVRICINSQVQNSVCVSPAGYAYAGNCDA